MTAVPDVRDPLTGPDDITIAFDPSADVDRAVREARRLARAIPGIDEASFDIGLDGTDAYLDARVTVGDAAHFSRAVDDVMETVIPAMERALGHAFTDNRIDFSIAGPTGSGGATGPTQILSIV